MAGLLADAGAWPMRRGLLAGIAVYGVLAGHALWAQAERPDEELETVLVIGEQPGPGLWKVSKDDRVMWVLGTHQPLPRHMTWRSQQVEARIAESQEVLLPSNVNIRADVGLLRGLTLIPAAIKASRIPDDRTLQDVLSAETWRSWRTLRDQYMPRDDDVERQRPAIAIARLRSAAIDRHQLSGGVNVRSVVDRAAKQHKVRVRRLPTIERTVRVENPRGMLKGASQVDLPDIDCFTQGVEQLEPEIERMKALANAWGRGDTEGLRRLHRVRQLEELCFYSLMAAFNERDSVDAARARKMLADTRWHAEQAAVQQERDWVAAAQAALARNRVTFAVLPMQAVFSESGYLARLRGLGYQVEEPQ